MRKKLFLAIAIIACAANGFASNEVVNPLEGLEINPSSSTNYVEEGVGILEIPNAGICSTTSYGYYTTTSPTQTTGLDGQTYYIAFRTYVTTGQCTTCTFMGHGGTRTETSCWGWGY